MNFLCILTRNLVNQNRKANLETILDLVNVVIIIMCTNLNIYSFCYKEPNPRRHGFVIIVINIKMVIVIRAKL